MIVQTNQIHKVLHSLFGVDWNTVTLPDVIKRILANFNEFQNIQQRHTVQTGKLLKYTQEEQSLHKL